MEEEKSQKENIFKSIGGVLPVLTVIIITLGLIKQILFYFNFNVPIKYFLGISELGLIISYDLLIILIAVVSMLFFDGIYSSKEKSTKDPKLKNKVWAIIFLTLPLLFMIIALMGIFIEKVYSTRLNFYALFLFCSGIEVIIVNPQLFHKHITNKSKFFIYKVLVITLCYILYISGRDIREVESGKYKGTIITTADSTYTSTDSSYFIGKTEKYIFIYNEKNKKTRIIPSESVKLIDMQSK